MGAIQDVGHRIVGRVRDAGSSLKKGWQEFRYEGAVPMVLGLGIRFGANNRRMISRRSVGGPMGARRRFGGRF